jgi:predicted small secreted protein
MGRLKRIAILCLLAACLCGSVALTGCNTMRGAGKDIEKAGEGIQRAVD